MSLTMSKPAMDDPEPFLFWALEAMRGAQIRWGDGFVTIEVRGDAVEACALAVHLTAAQAADKAIGEAMP